MSANIVFFAVIMLAFVIVLYARRGHAGGGARDYFVASGQFGGFLLFFLSVGETYSIGSILGFPAATYVQGTPFVLWFLGYIVLAFPLGYFVNPLIWRAGRRVGAMTGVDLFRFHFESRGLEKLVALNAIICLVPLGEMQFVGLLSVLKAFHWPVSGFVPMAGAAGVTFVWILLSGIRAPAYVSFIKDTLVVVAVLLVGMAALRALGVDGAATQTVPESPVHRSGEGNLLVMSTILFQAAGFCVAPANIAFLFTARSDRIVRRNQIVMPLYMLMFPFLYAVVMFARYGGGAGAMANDVFMTSATTLLPGWAVGLVAAACGLSGLVILAGNCLTLGPLVSHNLLHGLSDRGQRRGAQVVIGGYLLFSVVAADHLTSVMTVLNTLFYMGISQIIPGMIAIVLRKGVGAFPIGAGLVVGDCVSMGLALFGPQPAAVNVGMVGLLWNVAIVGVLEGIRRSQAGEAAMRAAGRK
ncbi:sodium:solute symporter family protein [Gluconacetobacter sp.]|uniref:sodium:solute symporter family protein n=1 Tax=Gluconacetobacter sp. TaxID=1935994 RepID=UPI0039E80163